MKQRRERTDGLTGRSAHWRIHSITTYHPWPIARLSLASRANSDQIRRLGCALPRVTTHEGGCSKRQVSSSVNRVTVSPCKHVLLTIFHPSPHGAPKHTRPGFESFATDENNAAMIPVGCRNEKFGRCKCRLHCARIHRAHRFSRDRDSRKLLLLGGPV